MEQENYTAPDPSGQVCINKKCGAPLPPDALYCPRCGRKQTHEQRKALKRPNGAGTVYKLSGRRRRPWVAAKNKVVLGYYETKTEALAALQREIGRTPNDRYNMTFEEVYQAWSREHFPRISQTTARNYESTYKIFAPLYTKRFRDLRATDFQAVFLQTGRKASSMKVYKVLLTQMSDWAVKNEIIQTNYASMIELPKSEKADKKIFTQGEIERIRADGSDEAKVTLMMIYTGMRIGEIFSLPAADVHDDYLIGGEKTEAGKNRIIPIPETVRPYFQEFKDRATDERLLSGLPYGNYLTFRTSYYAPMLGRLDIEYKPPHSCRHTYASMARAAGMPPEILQRILGHSSYQTTADIYVHVDRQTLIDAAGAAFASND